MHTRTVFRILLSVLVALSLVFPSVAMAEESTIVVTWLKTFSPRRCANWYGANAGTWICLGHFEFVLSDTEGNFVYEASLSAVLTNPADGGTPTTGGTHVLGDGGPNSAIHFNPNTGTYSTHFATSAWGASGPGGWELRLYKNASEPVLLGVSPVIMF